MNTITQPKNLLNFIQVSLFSIVALTILQSCSTDANEQSKTDNAAKELTHNEISYNILNSANWNQYTYDKQLVILYYCGDTSEIQEYAQVQEVRSHMANRPLVDYYEFFTDDLKALTPINDSMFFDLSDYLEQDGYLLLKNGKSMQVALHNPVQIITQQIDAFFEP
jgi:hypothetical protein